MKKGQIVKQEQVEEIKSKMQNSESVVVLDYRGLTVEEDTELRNKFREANVDYKVYKNTLVRRAAKELGIMDQFNDELLVGPSSFAFGIDDPVSPAKVSKDFIKDHPKLEIKMGYVEGEFYDADKMQAIASIPSREELIAKLLSSLKSPMADFAYLIQAIADKKAEEGDTGSSEVASKTASSEEAAAEVKQTLPVEDEKKEAEQKPAGEESAE